MRKLFKINQWKILDIGTLIAEVLTVHILVNFVNSI